MKDARFPPELSRSADPATGAPVWQLTAAPCINHHAYFLNPSLTPDESALIFSSNRSGSWQLYSIEPFPEGEIRQWTCGEPIHPFSPAIHPGGDRVFFVRGGSVWEIRRDTLEERLVAGHADGQLGEVSLSADGAWLAAAAKIRGEHGLVAGRADGSAWAFHRFPRTVIHPQFHPLEPEWLEFAADPAPRMHRMRRDGAGLECLYEHCNDEFVVHETFLGSTGDLVYVEWPRALWRMSWTTRERRRVCEFNAWHIAPSRDGARILCDTNHPDLGIFLIDADTGSQRLVCLSQSSNRGTQWTKSRYALADDFAAARLAHPEALSWMENAADTVYGPQWTHPHPSFSPRERFAIFTSDRSGHPQVYAVEIHG
ncbi:MAG: oligogalacturonate lyase family protein [Bryobacteraceae bacterium]|nr:oligogalacturonate lyase family protein [Bryobacteraceae bacterium]